MSLSRVYARACLGLEAPLVSVETHLSNGLPGFAIVGLPEVAVKESRDRVRSALINCGFELPAKRIIVNLAPADLPKAGGRYDLAIALGILLASGQLQDMQTEPDGLTETTELMGELALSGELRALGGIMPGLLACRAAGRRCIIPAANLSQAAMLGSDSILGCRHLLDLCAYLKGEAELLKPQAVVSPRPAAFAGLEDMIGQFQARRALCIAAAGGHNLLMRGPPGTGKTMLANRIRALLPALRDEQALEVAAVRSVSGEDFSPEACYEAPFRAPHHTSSAVALVGGGRNVHPGEISRAHHGVLFLDELPEFSSKVLEVLREPLESGSILIARAAYQLRLPAEFQLIAAMNPCPCGYYGDGERECRCTEERVRSYQQRISGPLLDRIDIHLEVPGLSAEERRQLLHSSQPQESTASLRERVRSCRALQLQRSGCLNARLETPRIRAVCKLQKAEQALLEQAMQRLQLSARAFFRILKLARTIADFEQCADIDGRHIGEAISYRKFDRFL